MWIVANKQYYLLKENNGFRKWICSNFFGKEEVKKTSEFFTTEEVMELGEKVKDEFLNRVNNDRMMKMFWKRASDEKRIAIMFSYALRKSGKYRKIGNIEIGAEWDKLKEHKSPVELKKFLKGLNLVKFKKTADWFIRRIGNHNKSLRYGNIHLSIDRMAGKKVYGIHWDNHYPKFLTRDMLFHWLHDVFVPKDK